MSLALRFFKIRIDDWAHVSLLNFNTIHLASIEMLTCVRVDRIGFMFEPTN